jgi:hypothetical protein
VIRRNTAFKLWIVGVVVATVAGCWNWNAFSQRDGVPDMMGATDGGIGGDGGGSVCAFGNSFGSCVFAP